MGAATAPGYYCIEKTLILKVQVPMFENTMNKLDDYRTRTYLKIAPRGKWIGSWEEKNVDYSTLGSSEEHGGACSDYDGCLNNNPKHKYYQYGDTAIPGTTYTASSYTHTNSPAHRTGTSTSQVAKYYYEPENPKTFQECNWAGTTFKKVDASSEYSSAMSDVFNYAQLETLYTLTIPYGDGYNYPVYKVSKNPARFLHSDILTNPSYIQIIDHPLDQYYGIIDNYHLNKWGIEAGYEGYQSYGYDTDSNTLHMNFNTLTSNEIIDGSKVFVEDAVDFVEGTSDTTTAEGASNQIECSSLTSTTGNIIGTTEKTVDSGLYEADACFLNTDGSWKENYNLLIQTIGEIISFFILHYSRHFLNSV